MSVPQPWLAVVAEVEQAEMALPAIVGSVCKIRLPVERKRAAVQAVIRTF